MEFEQFLRARMETLDSLTDPDDSVDVLRAIRRSVANERDHLLSRVMRECESIGYQMVNIIDRATAIAKDDKARSGWNSLGEFQQGGIAIRYLTANIVKVEEMLRVIDTLITVLEEDPRAQRMIEKAGKVGPIELTPPEF